MFDKLIAEFARRHGLSQDVLDALPEFANDLLRATHEDLTMISFVPSTLSDLQDDGPNDTLEPVTVRMPEGLVDSMSDDLTTEEQGTLESVTHGSRYQDLGVIGSGGMGEVRRVRDLELNRVGAMKILRSELSGDPGTVARFVEEAQASAQLEHPGIIPVHELGRLPDGRLYFTMKRVRGRTLGEVIREVHSASTGHDWAPGPSGWNFHRLVDAFHRICEAVAYAHDRSVIHRDLKPSNIMVGDYGEVLVLDWGLAKLLGHQRQLDLDGAVAVDGVRAHQTDPGALDTLAGSVFGTPSYMSPEQARGEVEELGPPSDVYSLGAILYEILAGMRPYGDLDSFEALHEVLIGSPPPPSIRHPVPEVLLQIRERAMARDPDDRYPDAAEMAAEIGGWLEGSRRRDFALRAIERADALAPVVQDLRHRAASLRRRAAELLGPIKPWETVERKRPGWALEDEAHELEREADVREATRTQFLNAAITHAPDLVEARERLAGCFRDLHANAEASGETDAAARLEAILRSHLEKLVVHGGDTPTVHSVQAYLEGTGRLTLVTDPPGANVEIFRYVERHRRLVTERIGKLGRTPLIELPLKAGSYLLKIRAPGREELTYPVLIRRQEHWHGTPPGATEPRAVKLPWPQEFGPEDCYVPEGWFSCGGDHRASGALSRSQVWVDAVVFRAYPVTHREYIEFLDDLSNQGRHDEATRFAPRAGEVSIGDTGAMMYTVRGKKWNLGATYDGSVVLARQPVTGVDWHGARAYSHWYAQRTGLPWRLPAELEWEKAARGVDGRSYPWGNFLDPTWCCMRESHPGRRMIAVVDSFEADTSPYGLRGTAGNAFDWCADAYVLEGPPLDNQRVVPPSDDDAPATLPRVTRGGGWDSPKRFVRLASRIRADPRIRADDVGFRLARSPMRSSPS